MPFVAGGPGVVGPEGNRSGPTSGDTIQPHTIPVPHPSLGEIRSLSDIRDDVAAFLRRYRYELMLAPLGSDPASSAAVDAHNEIVGYALTAVDDFVIRLGELVDGVYRTTSRLSETEP